MTILEGRGVLVTGAAQGIGAAFARGLSAAGARVCLCDILPTDGIVGEIEATGGEAIGQHCDITEVGQVEAVVRRAEQAFGRIDGLLNNAALFAKLSKKPFTEIPSEEWDQVMKINTRGIFEFVRCVTPIMRRQRYGKIINISSGTVMAGIPLMLHYVTSKAAVIGMTRSLARELGADNICVNAIAPGLTLSDGVKGDGVFQSSRDMSLAVRALKREQQPEDLVGAAVFLASAMSDFVTGQTLLVDGGASMQ